MERNTVHDKHMCVLVVVNINNKNTAVTFWVIFASFNYLRILSMSIVDTYVNIYQLIN
jgi:hypothetical protein